MSKPATRSGCSIAARITLDGSATSPWAPAPRTRPRRCGPAAPRREGGGQPRAQRRQHEVGALVAERLVEPAQAIEVGDHQLVAARWPAAVRGRGRRSCGGRAARSARPARRRRSASRGRRRRRRARPPPARRRARGRLRRRASAAARRSPTPGSRTRSMSSTAARSCGSTSARRAAEAASGASGARPSARDAPVSAQAVALGLPASTAPTSAAPRASRVTVVASQTNLSCRRHPAPQSSPRRGAPDRAASARPRALCSLAAPARPVRTADDLRQSR